MKIKANQILLEIGNLYKASSLYLLDCEGIYNTIKDSIISNLKHGETITYFFIYQFILYYIFH